MKSEFIAGTRNLKIAKKNEINPMWNESPIWMLFMFKKKNFFLWHFILLQLPAMKCWQLKWMNEKHSQIWTTITLYILLALTKHINALTDTAKHKLIYSYTHMECAHTSGVFILFCFHFTHIFTSQSSFGFCFRLITVNVCFDHFFYTKNIGGKWILNPWRTQFDWIYNKQIVLIIRC